MHGDRDTKGVEKGRKVQRSVSLTSRLRGLGNGNVVSFPGEILGRAAFANDFGTIIRISVRVAASFNVF